MPIEREGRIYWVDCANEEQVPKDDKNDSDDSDDE